MSENDHSRILIDVHHISSKIISRYIAVLNDYGVEKELKDWLYSMRERLWKECSSPSGLCSLDNVDKVINMLINDYERFLLGTSYSFDEKMRIYRSLYEILDEINRFIKMKYDKYDLLQRLRKPSLHKLEISIKNIDIKRASPLRLELSDPYKGALQTYVIESRRESIDVPVGTYQIRLLDGEREIYKTMIRVSEDSVLNISIDTELEKEKRGRRIKRTIEKRKETFYRGRLEVFLKIFSRKDLNTIALIILLILVILDIIILLR
jgi:hypothetical protein